MINKVLENQNLLKLLFSFSILLIFLDSYQVLNTPLSWVGNLLLTLICLIIFRKEKMKFNLLFFIIVFVTLLPTIFSLFTMTYNFVNLNYLGIRLFSYLGFILVFFVIINFGYKEAIVESLKIIFYLISIMSIYFFIAQIFNIPEPIRNRPGTGILGFDIQTTFWSSGSHRMLGTFREPVFLVSLLFPSFIVLHYKTKNNFLFYLLSGIIFGLTKSELSLLLIFAITIVDIFLKNFKLKNLIFFISYFLFFILPIQECDISPSNIECPNEDLSGTIEEIVELDIAKDTNELSNVENDIDNQESNLTSLLNENRERLDIISFTTNRIFENTGYGFLSINKVYTEYLDQEVSHKMYLTNRTLPKYLKVQYLSDSFGTGRYFLTYEIVNIQNNFLFNFFSIGMFYLILNILVIIFSFQKNFSHGLKVFLLLISIGLGSMEDLLPLFGLYLSLMFTMELNES